MSKVRYYDIRGGVERVAEVVSESKMQLCIQNDEDDHPIWISHGQVLGPVEVDEEPETINVGMVWVDGSYIPGDLDTGRPFDVRGYRLSEGVEEPSRITMTIDVHDLRYGPMGE